MFVPSFILIERGLDWGPILHTKQDVFFCSKISEYQCFAVCCTETSSCASKPLLLRCKLDTYMSVPRFIRIERGSDGGP